MVDNIRENGGAAKEADFTIPFEGFQRLDGFFLLQNISRGAEVELEDVEIVSFHAAQALVTCLDYVLAAVVV